MTSVRRIFSSSLAVLLALEALGPSAFAQVAARAASAPGRPVAPAFVAPLLSLPVASLSPLAAPSLSAMSFAAAPLPAAAVVAPLAAPAVPLAALARPAVSVQVSVLHASSAEALEKISSDAASRGDLRRSGDELEGLLSGEPLRRPASADDGAVAARPSRAGQGLRPASAAPGESASEPAAPLPEVPAPARAAFRLYAAGVTAVKVGIEALNLVVPAFLLTQGAAASVVAGLFLSAQVAALAASWVAGPLVDRFGPAKVLAATASLQIAAIGAIPVAFAFGTTLGLPVIFGLFAVNGLLGGAFDIARRAALPGILGRDERVLNAYNAKIYIARELAAMAAIFGTGYLLGKLGYLAVLGIHPAAYVVAALLFARLAFRGGASAPPASEPAPAAKAKGLRAALEALTRGARLVWSDPALRRAALLNIPVLALHNLFHQILAVVYAAKVLGSPAAAAVLLGAWNLGEFAAALLLRRQAARQGEKASLGPAWLRYAAAAVLGSWLLWLFPSVYVAAPVIFLMALAMLGNELALASYFQSAASKEDSGAVTGFVYSLSTTFGMAALLAMGWLFDGFGATAGFLALAIALTAASVFFWTSSRHR